MSYRDMARDAGATSEDEIRRMAWMLEEQDREQANQDAYERALEEEQLQREYEKQEDEFCPACDAGTGHCIGPHKGSDEIPF